MPLIQLTMLTGFVAGILGTLFGYLAHYFNFTSISPSVILTPLNASWKAGWAGSAITLALYGLISILAALLYYALFRKITSLYCGVAYGLGIFILLFILAPIVTPGVTSILTKDLNTIITELCFFILYGTFIGYSISYEYSEQLYLKNVKIKQ